MNIEQVYRHFKLLRKNCDLDLRLKHYYIHKCEKVLASLNFDDNKSINVKKKKSSKSI